MSERRISTETICCQGLSGFKVKSPISPRARHFNMWTSFPRTPRQGKPSLALHWEICCQRDVLPLYAVPVTGCLKVGQIQAELLLRA